MMPTVKILVVSVSQRRGRNKQEDHGGLEGSESTLCDTVLVDAYSTFIWAHRMHAKREPDIHGLQALSDK